MTTRVLKWVVPLDDQPHEIGGGQVLHVDFAQPHFDAVSVWTLEVDHTPAPRRNVQVHGTGQPITPGSRHLGSVVAGLFVWHVFELNPGGRYV